MKDSWAFGKKLGAAFTFAGFTLLMIAIFGYESAHRLIENSRWVAHTYEVRGAISELGSALKDAETGTRGYVLSGNESFLEPYASAHARIDGTLETLRKLTADNPNQQRRLEISKPLILTKLGALKSYIDARRSAGLESAATLVAAGSGEHSMEQLRQVFMDMDREEQTLLERRHQEAESSAEMTKAVIAWGSVLGLIVITLGAWFMARSLTTQIGSAVRHVQSSAAELQSAANQQATGAREQATAMNEITTTISELLATSRQIADSAQRVAQIAGETVSAAALGGTIVQRTSESLASIKRQVEVVVGHMLDLGKKSQEIGGILEIINELAEQTNILAINATIEAAGAGEAGKRFAVVAEEIRRLADRVGGSTKEIRELIDEVRAAVNTTVMATESGTKAVDAGARQFGEASATFSQIASLVGTTTEAAREIQLSTKQQSTAVEQVNVAAANVAQATKETEASSGQTLQTASQLATLSRDLLRVIQSSKAA